MWVWVWVLLCQGVGSQVCEEEEAETGLDFKQVLAGEPKISTFPLALLCVCGFCNFLNASCSLASNNPASHTLAPVLNFGAKRQGRKEKTTRKQQKKAKQRKKHQTKRELKQAQDTSIQKRPLEFVMMDVCMRLNLYVCQSKNVQSILAEKTSQPSSEKRVLMEPSPL